ncbi:MAG: PAS domain-containing protein [Acidimicrobiales bacterium]
MDTTGTDVAAMRTALSRHPLALECARVAHHLTGGVVEVVVFESGRAFIAASTDTHVLQPRALSRAEIRLIRLSLPSVHEGDAAAVAIRDGAGGVVGALSIHGTDSFEHAEAIEGLSRMITADLASGARRPAAIETAILDSLRDGVVIVDRQLKICWANRAMTSLVSRSPTEVVGMAALDLLHPDDVGEALEAIHRLTRGLATYRAVVRLARGGGGWERVEVTGLDRSSDPAVGGLLLSLRAAEAGRRVRGDREQRPSRQRGDRRAAGGRDPRRRRVRRRHHGQPCGATAAVHRPRRGRRHVVARRLRALRLRRSADRLLDRGRCR